MYLSSIFRKKWKEKSEIKIFYCSVCISTESTVVDPGFPRGRCAILLFGNIFAKNSPTVEALHYRPLGPPLECILGQTWISFITDANQCRSVLGNVHIHGRELQEPLISWRDFIGLIHWEWHQILFGLLKFMSNFETISHIFTIKMIKYDILKFWKLNILVPCLGLLKCMFNFETVSHIFTIKN